MAKFKLKKGKKYYGFKDGKRHKYVEGDVIDIDPDRLKYHMDIFDPLEPIEAEDERHAAPRTQLKAVYRDDGKYDVVNEVVEIPINDVPLTKKEARALVDGKNLVALDKEEKSKTTKKEDITTELKEKIEIPLKLKAVHKGGGKYNVINEATGKPVNDVLLSKKEAFSLAADGVIIDLSDETMDFAEKKEKPDEKGTDPEDLAKGDRVYTRRRTKSK